MTKHFSMIYFLFSEITSIRFHSFEFDMSQNGE